MTHPVTAELRLMTPGRALRLGALRLAGRASGRAPTARAAAGRAECLWTGLPLTSPGLCADHQGWWGGQGRGGVPDVTAGRWRVCGASTPLPAGRLTADRPRFGETALSRGAPARVVANLPVAPGSRRGSHPRRRPGRKSLSAPYLGRYRRDAPSARRSLVPPAERRPRAASAPPIGRAYQPLRAGLEWAALLIVALKC